MRTVTSGPAIGPAYRSALRPPGVRRPLDPAVAPSTVSLGAVLPLHSGPPRSDVSAAPTTDVASEDPAWDASPPGLACVEIAAAIVLLAATGIGGVCFAHGTRPSWLDTWFPSFIGSGHRSVLTDVTSLRYPLVIVIGAVVSPPSPSRGTGSGPWPAWWDHLWLS